MNGWSPGKAMIAADRGDIGAAAIDQNFHADAAPRLRVE
jgi:hypothetical protein